MDTLTTDTLRPLFDGLRLEDLEEVLVAIGDREDVADEAGRARLARGRRALEREAALALAD